MTDGREDDALEGLYEELKQFAPADTIDEMTQLADRLKQLEPEAGDPVKKPDLDEIWQRVEQQLDERPDTDGS